MSMSPCPRCNGSGSINTDVCTKCHGSGTQHSVSTISVKIPAGIDNGDTIRLVGQGNKGPQGGVRVTCILMFKWMRELALMCRLNLIHSFLVVELIFIAMFPSL